MVLEPTGTDEAIGAGAATSVRSAATTVAVCDDHAVVREGVIRIVAAAAGFAVVSCTGTAQDLYEDLEQTPVDICIIDLGLPDANGVEVVAEVLARYPEMKVLVLTNHAPESVGLVCVEAGARGFLSKGAPPDELVEALGALRRGDVHLPREVINALVRKDSATQRHARLSPREWEVFVRLAQGSRINEVASELNLDQRTVTTYRRRVLDKLGVDSNAGIVAYAILHGLIDADAVVNRDR